MVSHLIALPTLLCFSLMLLRGESKTFLLPFCTSSAQSEGAEVVLEAAVPVSVVDMGPEKTIC